MKTLGLKELVKTGKLTAKSAFEKLVNKKTKTGKWLARKIEVENMQKEGY